MMVREPRADRCSNDDGIFVGGHGVLYIGRNEQEAADGIGLEVLEVERFAKADLQYTLNNRNPGVAGMRVKVMEPRRDESGVCECFAGHIASPFQHRPFRPIRIDFLPHNCFRVPGLRCFSRFGGRSRQ